jgi:hypothetical protein
MKVYKDSTNPYIQQPRPKKIEQIDQAKDIST